MNRPYRILLVEDSTFDAILVKNAIGKVLDQSEILIVETKETFSKALMEFRPDIILSDLSLPVFDWLHAFRIAKEQSPLIPFIIVTGSTSKDYAAECIKAGVIDVILKDHIEKLGPVILKALFPLNDRNYDL
jgi:CheY-like chemotaxis protein